MSELLTLRHDYAACLKLADETDSKREDARLRSEAVDALTKLRATCPHTETVVLRSEYGGSYTDDYDDKHPEDRICLCCGAKESAYGKRFATLVARPFKRFEGRAPREVTEPLTVLLFAAVEAAEFGGYAYRGDR